MAAAFDFSLNGQNVRVENLSPNTTLLEFLRATGRTGTKEGCAEGDCGACSVAIVESDANGKKTFRAINSCLIPICLLAGREVISVEGVACGTTLHPVQQKMVECHGSQCGYCTPGFIMSLFEGYHRDDLKTAEQLDEQLCGNLCRCTGYRPIRDAALEAFAERSVRLRLGSLVNEQHAGPETGAPVEYESHAEQFFRPTSLAQLFQLIAAHPTARLIAGATELGLDITKRFKKFSTLISVEAVSELRNIESTEHEWRVGAAATLTNIEDKLGDEFPALRDMLRVFGSRQIRNRATMGGNIVTASPIGDSAPVLLALDARIVLAAKGGERVLPVADFFVSYRKTAVQSGEILKTILIPRPASTSGQRLTRWFKVSKRREMDISTVAACFVVELDSAQRIQLVRLAFGGVAATPLRAVKTEAALLGKTWSEETVRSVLPLLRGEFTPISDVRGSAEYRSELIGSLLEKFFHDGAPSIGRPEVSERTSGRAMLGAPLKSLPHESAHKHVTGEAIYTDDAAARRGMLEVWPVCAPHARARIVKRDATTARTMPGVRAVLLAEDVPGVNDVGAVRHDEVLLADKEISFHGQLVALVVGESQEACRAAAVQVVVEYEPLAPVLTIPEAIAQNSFHTEANSIRRGDCASGLNNAPQKLEGDFAFGGQEHFYLEMQAAWAEPGEDGSMFVMSSTQHPSEVQHIVAHVLHVPVNHVVVQSPRMGGGFGGKETQAATFAALAALAAAKTQRPVRVRVNRDLDMMLTGKRHPFLAKFKVGFDGDGHLLAAKVELFSNGGWSLDLSMPVTDRAVFHLDNAYYIPHVEFSGRVAKTNVASNTAFRGFGGPQGMLVIEEIIARIARQLGLPPEVVRERNLYRGTGETNTTHYGQEVDEAEVEVGQAPPPVSSPASAPACSPTGGGACKTTETGEGARPTTEPNRIQRVWQELKVSSAFEQRRAEITEWNFQHPHLKRGLAMTPVKFGISFTLTHLNQAGALVLIYQDGTVQVNHGGTEMGQGINTNMAMIAARELGIAVDAVRVMPTSTDKVPNTSATAASCGTDLNGMAVKNACEILRTRLAPVAAKLLATKLGRDIKDEEVTFRDGAVHAKGAADTFKFSEVVTQAYLQRISLSSTGYYRTPEIHYDRAAGRGKPFHYFSVGAAASEVEVDGFTGMTRVLRTDILHDVGYSINAGINRGQIEGGFVQGLGWLTAEELVWDQDGKLLTHSPDTYKIPAIGDTPREFNVAFLTNATQRHTIFGSKAVGEPPLMLAISVREAIRDAVAAFGDGKSEVNLASPATGEAIFRAIQEMRIECSA